MQRIAAIALVALAAAAPLTDAKTLRWSSQGDYLTADPTAQNELLTNSINGHVYETLVMRGKKLEILPGLATSWKQTGPTTWIFNLRKGVKWHDGSDFTADDVVFSIKRSRADLQLPRLRQRRRRAEQDRRPHVELTTPVPNPVMLEMHANSLFIMNKAWCEKNNAVKPRTSPTRKRATRRGTPWAPGPTSSSRASPT
jgi:peptide/nickel transport system substrate-binding protein